MYPAVQLTDLPDSGRALFVGQDIIQSGRLAAQIMYNCLRPGEKVPAAVGNMKYDGHLRRFQWFSGRMPENTVYIPT